MQKTINELGTTWKDRLPDALWAYRTTYKTPLGMSPYQLVHGKTGHLPVELEFKAHWSIRRWNMDFEAVGTKRKMQLSKLDEWHEKAYHNAKIYKERTKRWHERRIKKEFVLGDKVLLFNSNVKLFGHRKLRSKWEGPFKVISTSSHGAVTLQNDEGTLFKVNEHHLKIFLEPKKPHEDLDEIDLLILP